MNIENKKLCLRQQLESWLGIVISASIYIIFVGINVGVNIPNIIIGGNCIDQCTVERYLPIYLIVSGCQGIFNSLIIAIRFFIEVPNVMKYALHCSKKTKLEFCQSCVWVFNTWMLGLLGFFGFLWFACGNVWIYRAATLVQFNNSTEKNYCKWQCYNTALWSVNSSYIVGVFFTVLAIILIVIGYKRWYKKKNAGNYTIRSQSSREGL